MRLLLYGVAWSGHLIPEKEHSDQLNITTIQGDDLGVVAGEMPDDLLDDAPIADEYAVGHLDALVQMVRNGPVLPLRFGTIAPSPQDVRDEVLGPAAEELRRGLEAIKDLVELRIDLTFDEQYAVRMVYESDPSIRELARGRSGGGVEVSEQIEFGQAVAERLAERRTEAVTSWLSRLDGWVETASVLQPPNEGTERVALLAHRDQVPGIDTLVEELSSTRPSEELRVDYVGPLPAFTFAEKVMGQAEPMRSTWGW